MIEVFELETKAESIQKLFDTGFKLGDSIRAYRKNMRAVGVGEFRRDGKQLLWSLLVVPAEQYGAYMVAQKETACNMSNERPC